MFYPDYGPTTKYLSGVIDDRTNYQNIRFEYRPRNWTDDGSNVGRNSLFIRSEIPIDTDKVFIKFFKRKNRRWRNISSLNFGYLHDESGRDSDIGTVIYSPIGKLEPAEVVVHKEKKVYERVISNKLYKVQVPAYFVFAGPDMEERHVSVPLGDFDVCAQMFLTTFSPRNKGGHTWYYDEYSDNWTIELVDSREKKMIYVNGNQVMETELFVPEIKHYSSNILGCALVDEKGNLLSLIFLFKIISNLKNYLKDTEQLHLFGIPSMDLSDFEDMIGQFDLSAFNVNNKRLLLFAIADIELFYDIIKATLKNLLDWSEEDIEEFFSSAPHEPEKEYFTIKFV